MPDKLSTFLVPSRLSKPSSYPAILRDCRQPHALIAAYGDAMGLPMDWTKSRALCNPASTPLHPLSTSLPAFPLALGTAVEGKSIFLPICQGCAFDGRSKDIGGRNFLFLLLLLYPRPAPFISTLLFYFPFHPDKRQAIPRGRAHR